MTRRRSTRDGVPFPMVCRVAGLPAPVPEYQFALVIGRKWRFDWAWPDVRVALEVEGGAWVAGRHVRGKGFLDDIEKYNYAQRAGWAVLRCVPKTLASAGTFQVLQDVITRRMQVTT